MPTDNSAPDPSWSVRVHAEPEAAASSVGNEPTNIFRVAALSTLLNASPTTSSSLQQEFLALGFSARLLGEAPQWMQFTRLPIPTPSASLNRSSDQGRIHAWSRLNGTLQVSAAADFLWAVLGSTLERESVAAAVAWLRWINGRRHVLGMPESGTPPFQSTLDSLWARRLSSRLRLALAWPIGTLTDDRLHVTSRAWEARDWQRRYDHVASVVEAWPKNAPWQEVALLIALLARLRVEIAMRSPDSITRSLARAALIGQGPRGSGQPRDVIGQKVGNHARLSTMVHGVRGWRGCWWRPGSEFHSYVGSFLGGLYHGGRPYSWSGRLGERVEAAEDLRKWTSDGHSVAALRTVFAHSYGGDVTARAIGSGLAVKRLVLLSAPITRAIRDINPDACTVTHVRLRLDPVLALAAVDQVVRGHFHLKSPDWIEEIILTHWTLDHGATHSKQVWIDEDVGARAHFL